MLPLYLGNYQGTSFILIDLSISHLNFNISLFTVIVHLLYFSHLISCAVQYNNVASDLRIIKLCTKFRSWICLLLFSQSSARIITLEEWQKAFWQSSVIIFQTLHFSISYNSLRNSTKIQSAALQLIYRQKPQLWDIKCFKMFLV